MINLGASSLIHWKDDWTATTRDGKRSAQFEETILCVPLSGIRLPPALAADPFLNVRPPASRQTAPRS